jgi:hypothetical protein
MPSGEIAKWLGIAAAKALNQTVPEQDEQDKVELEAALRNGGEGVPEHWLWFLAGGRAQWEALLAER